MDYADAKVVRICLTQIGIRLAGAFPMAEMVLSGILSASVRILLLATPRRLRLDVARYAFG